MEVWDGYPEELWLEIAFYLRPRDVFALSHSCRRLYNMITRREIWTPILRYTCRRHRLFLPSYPVGDMSLTHIQRAALGPHRWYRAVKRHHELCDLGDNRMLLRPNSKTPLVVDASHKVWFLIPGGRFILTADNLSIALWDIGVVGCFVNSPPRCVARTEISNRDVVPFELCNIAVQQVKEDSLRVAIFSIHNDLIVKVLAISPSHTQAQFTESAYLHVQIQCHRLCDLTFQGDMLLMRLGHSIAQHTTMVWDIVQGQYAMWDVRRLGQKVEVTLVGKVIVHFVPEEVLAWKVPPLEDLPSLPAPLSLFLVQQIPSVYSWSPFQLTAPFNFDVMFLRPHSWFNHPQLSYIFDALLIPPLNSNQPTMAHRYRLDLEQDVQDVEAILMLSYTLPDTHSYGHIPQKARSGCQVGIPPRAMISRVSFNPHDPEATRSEQLCVLSVADAPVVHVTAIQNRLSSSQHLCIGSGRFVFADSRLEGDESKLWVADY